MASKEKVFVVISHGQYVDSVKNGASYVSVGYSGRTYGGGSPCDDETEIQSAIKHAVKVIVDHGDNPIVSDQRVAQQTLF